MKMLRPRSSQASTYQQRLESICCKPSNKQLLSIAYFISIFFCLIFFSFTPESSDLSLPIVDQDWNIVHIPAYIMLTTALFAMLSVFYTKQMKSLVLSMLIATMIGVIIEVIQHLTGRTMSWGDFLFNETGIIVASILVMVWIFNKKSLSRVFKQKC